MILEVCQYRFSDLLSIYPIIDILFGQMHKWRVYKISCICAI